MAKKIKDLDDTLIRLRKENEIEYLKRQLDRGKDKKTTANKNLSIKDASDEELEAIIRRLKSERDAQRIIQDLKNNGDKYPSDYLDEVSTEKSVNSLYHYGVLGMKWGVRKGSSSTSKGESSDDYKKASSLASKNPNQLSNSQLKTVNQRLNLEQQYKSLTKKQKSKGAKFVSDVMTNSSKKVLTEFASKQMSKTLEKAVTKTAEKAKTG